jgi:hypothetical protein
LSPSRFINSWANFDCCHWIFGENPEFSPLTLLWLPPAPPARLAPALAAAFRGEQAVANFRTGLDPQDAFIAIKGGTPAASHGHMDVGSFVYDADNASARRVNGASATPSHPPPGRIKIPESEP